jgi:hypothetical protein
MKNFKFNHVIAFFVIFSMAMNTIKAQSNLNFCMKGGIFAGGISISKSVNAVTNEKSFNEPGSGSVAAAFSLPIVKKFRLGAEMGINTVDSYFDKTVTTNFSGTLKYQGHYKINQAFIAIAPEYRIKPWLYVNAGGGFYNDFNSSFTSGRLSSNSGTDIDLTGQQYRREYSFGSFVGVGFCPNITNEMALLAEIKYLSCSPSGLSDENLAFGLNVVNINIGIMYKPKQ